MIRSFTSIALGIAVSLLATGAFAQDDAAGGDAPAADAPAADAPAADAPAAPASGGDAAAGASMSTDGADAGGKKMALGADLAFLMPLGSFGDATGPLIGALLKFQYLATPHVGVTGRAGYLFGLGKSQTVPVLGEVKYSISDIPIWVGGRYFLGEGEGLHFGAEVGLNNLSASVSIGGTSASSSKSYFGVNIPVGYKIGDLDIAAQFSMLDMGHAGDSQAVGLTVGYDFAKF